jgi:Mrp family chromosome partitioning ATPase
MSQNFELLKRLEAEISVGTKIPEATPRINFAEADEAPRATSSVEEVARPIEYAPASQELLSLAQAVFFSGNGNAPHEVVLADVDQNGGSSQICLKLGRILASAATRPVCLIDADFDSSRLTSLIESGRPARVTFSESQCYLEIEPRLYLASKLVLDPVRSGSLAPSQFLKKSVEDLRQTFEYILIDVPGANHGNNAGVLGQLADAAILVIEANSTRKAAAAKAKKTMEAMNVKLLGTILNNRSYPIPEKLYQRL